MKKSSDKKEYRPIPTELKEAEFNKYILPSLSRPKRGPKCKVSYWLIFNLILDVLYTGMQWKKLAIPKDATGKSVIHYTQVYRYFAKWSTDGSLEKVFTTSVAHLMKENKLDLSVINGDGTNTIAKKGGDYIGYSGHKHQTGEKIITIVDKNGYVIAPLTAAPVNEADMILLPGSVKLLKTISQALDLNLTGTVFNLDAGFDSKKNRRIIQQLEMKPNIKENSRNRKKIKPGPKRYFDAEIYKLRFVVERTFGWEDKFRRLLIRWERIHQRHLAFHLIAFTLINLKDLILS